MSYGVIITPEAERAIKNIIAELIFNGYKEDEEEILALRSLLKRPSIHI